MSRKLNIGLLLLLFVAMCVIASTTLFDVVAGDISSDEYPKQFASFVVVIIVLVLAVLMPLQFILSVNQGDSESYLLRSRSRLIIFIVFVMAFITTGGTWAVQTGQTLNNDFLKGIGVEILGAVLTATSIVFLERYLGLLIDMNKDYPSGESESSYAYYRDLHDNEVISHSIE